MYDVTFDLVYTDFWGLMTFMSNTIFHYYISFVDACTEYTWTYDDNFSLHKLRRRLGVKQLKDEPK